MSRKKTLIILALVIVLAVPFSVFAATSDTPAAKTLRGFFGIDISKLNDKQKADITDYTKKMADLQKEFINQMVANGTMTKEQGDAAIKQIDAAAKNGDVGSFLKSFGKGGFNGDGKRIEFGFGKMDLSKLTDEQKAGLKDSHKKITELQKEYIGKMVANGLLTKEQGDRAAEKFDKIIEEIDENGFFKGIGLMMGGFEGPSFIGTGRDDQSKLTDQQKADMDEFTKKMTDLQKELINKMVSYGVMTKDQGDAAAKMIEDMSKFPQGEKFFMKEMKKGEFGGRMKKGIIIEEKEREALPTT